MPFLLNSLASQLSERRLHSGEPLRREQDAQQRPDRHVGDHADSGPEPEHRDHEEREQLHVPRQAHAQPRAEPLPPLSHIAVSARDGGP